MWHVLSPCEDWEWLASNTSLQLTSPPSKHPPRGHHSDLLKSKANPITPLDKAFQSLPFIQVQVWAHLPSPQNLYNLSSTCIAETVFIQSSLSKMLCAWHSSELQILSHLIFVKWDRPHYLYTHFFTDEKIKIQGGNALLSVTPAGGHTQPIGFWGPAFSYHMSASPTALPS